MYKFEIDTIIL